MFEFVLFCYRLWHLLFDDFIRMIESSNWVLLNRVCTEIKSRIMLNHENVRLEEIAMNTVSWQRTSFCDCSLQPSTGLPCKQSFTFYFFLLHAEKNSLKSLTWKARLANEMLECNENLNQWLTHLGHKLALFLEVFNKCWNWCKLLHFCFSFSGVVWAKLVFARNAYALVFFSFRNDSWNLFASFYCLLAFC